MFHAKVTTALLLDELAGDDLDAFVLFSSASSAVGNPGQANYAAANAVLDALAEARRARGASATSVSWGAWGGGGMAGDDAGNGAAEEAARRAGIALMDPRLAVETLMRLAGGTLPTAVVAEVALERFAEAFGGSRPSALLREFPGYDEMVAARAATPAVDDGFADRLAAMPPARRLDTVVELVRTRAAQILGYPDTDDVGAEKSFRDLGIDSLGAVELRNQLGAATGLDLPATLVFDQPNPAAVGRFVLDELGGGDDAGAVDAEEAEIRTVLATVPLAKLREIGVLEPLLQLAGRADAPDEDDGPGGGSVDDLSVDDLVKAALDGASDDDQ